MRSHPPSPGRFCLFVTALTAFYSYAMIMALMCFLRDAALAAVPFGGHTADLGREFVWTNRIAVLFLIVFCALLAHALARMAQIVGAWRRRS